MQSCLLYIFVFFTAKNFKRLPSSLEVFAHTSTPRQPRKPLNEAGARLSV
jgi:hypothetical protein